MSGKLKRDAKYIRSLIEKKDGKVYCKERCTIEFPSWYTEKEIAIFMEEVRFFGVCAIIVGDKYAVSNIPTLIHSKPISITEIEREDGMMYTRLEFGKGDAILSNDKAVKETLKSYDFFQNYFVRSKIPWYMDYEDLVKAMGNLPKYANSRVGESPLGNELVVSFIARDPKDKKRYYRQTDMKAQYLVSDFMDLYNSVKSTTSRLSGGYFQEALVAAINDQPTTVTDMDKHLKG